MTTTISKHDLQLQLQQQQQLHQIQLQQQKQQQQPIHQQQPQRSTILFKNSTNTNLLLNNTVNYITNTTNTFDNPTANAVATTTTTRLDSATPTIIQIDSLNNNNHMPTTATTAITAALASSPTNLSYTTTTIKTSPAAQSVAPNNNNGLHTANNSQQLVGANSTDIDGQQPKSQKRRSLLNFKSFDFHIKCLYSGLRSNGNAKNSDSQSSSVGGNANGSCIIAITDDTPTTRPPTASGGGVGSGVVGGGVGVHNRMPPFLKIESVDTEESENLLLDYPQSPYSSRRNSSHDDNRSSSQLLHINRYEMSRSQASSPSPYFLSPYAIGSSSGNGNIRRSSTSDIVSCKRSGTSSASESRRPSTSDLLRKARERRGSEARMGRSVSHGGLTRGGFRSGCGGGPGGGRRRTSMAF